MSTWPPAQSHRYSAQEKANDELVVGKISVHFAKHSAYVLRGYVTDTWAPKTTVLLIFYQKPSPDQLPRRISSEPLRQAELLRYRLDLIRRTQPVRLSEHQSLKKNLDSALTSISDDRAIMRK